ncbi:Lipase 1 [Folsomia candida]|uniref:Lipase 1 n=1 Tax=Folsomia candida TaxID=158441 RepID=A0A226E7H9_FOLCA|nr:Lipase 1 [Folsomia candida]
MGIYDLPAIIEMVTETTGNKAMYYVGHSMGTSMLTVLLSMRPEYNDRILTGFLLSPAIHFGNTAPQLRFFMRGSNYFQTTLSILLGAFPDVISTKTWTHYVQLIHTDQFCQFNYGFKTKNREKYGSDSPPCYNLSKVTAPIVIYWGHNDIFVRPQVSQQHQLWSTKILLWKPPRRPPLLDQAPQQPPPRTSSIQSEREKFHLEWG